MTNISRTLSVGARLQTVPVLPRWLRVNFMVDTDDRQLFRDTLRETANFDSSAICGNYLWYQETNKTLEAIGSSLRLVILHREARQHYVRLMCEYDALNIGATRWERKIFVRCGLMDQPLRKYRTISSIFSHGEKSTALSKRVRRGANLDTIGLEIEVAIRKDDGGYEGKDQAIRLYNEGALDVRGGRFVIPCYDGSLGENGVEYKTGVFDMNFWNGKVAEDWRNRFRAQNFLAWTRRECGIHINIGRNNTFSSINTCQATQAFLFSAHWHVVEGKDTHDSHILRAYQTIAGRKFWQNEYCDGRNISRAHLGSHEKYQPMRLGHDRVEFRIFQSTTDQERLKYLPAFCLEIGKTVKRLESNFVLGSWNESLTYRREWGAQVWASLLQQNDNEDLKGWIVSRMVPDDVKLLQDYSLPERNITLTASELASARRDLETFASTTFTTFTTGWSDPRVGIRN